MPKTIEVPVEKTTDELVLIKGSRVGAFPMTSEKKIQFLFGYESESGDLLMQMQDEDNTKYRISMQVMAAKLIDLYVAEQKEKEATYGN